MIKDEQYITIQGFMINKYGLRGRELMLYALIYSYSQTVDTFSGSRAFMAEWLGCTLPTVDACLNSLMEKGLIRREHGHNYRHIMYTALTP